MQISTSYPAYRELIILLCVFTARIYPQGSNMLLSKQDLSSSRVLLAEIVQDPCARKIPTPCKLPSLERPQYQGQIKKSWQQPGSQLINCQQFHWQDHRIILIILTAGNIRDRNLCMYLPNKKLFHLLGSSSLHVNSPLK